MCMYTVVVVGSYHLYTVIQYCVARTSLQFLCSSFCVGNQHCHVYRQHRNKIFFKQTNNHLYAIPYYTVDNLVTVALKGQCHEIFDPFLSGNKNLPGPLVNNSKFMCRLCWLHRHRVGVVVDYTDLYV